MKRMLLFLLAALLLCSAAHAEEITEPCQHEYEKGTEILEDHNWVVYGDPAEAYLVSAVCRHCGDSCVIIKERELLIPEPCAQEACTHRMYALPAFSRTVWVPVENGFFHQRVEYDVAGCLDCGLVATVYEIKETSQHQMEEKQGFHIEGQYIHVTCQECLLCGLMTGALVPCITYEDGTCDRLPAIK